MQKTKVQLIPIKTLIDLSYSQLYGMVSDCQMKLSRRIGEECLVYKNGKRKRLKFSTYHVYNDVLQHSGRYVPNILIVFSQISNPNVMEYVWAVLDIEDGHIVFDGRNICQ
jgi:hypothetical protein